MRALAPRTVKIIIVGMYLGILDDDCSRAELARGALVELSRLGSVVPVSCCHLTRVPAINYV